MASIAICIRHSWKSCNGCHFLSRAGKGTPPRHRKSSDIMEKRKHPLANPTENLLLIRKTSDPEKKQQRRNKSSRLRTHEPGLWRLHSSNPVTAVRDHARERRGNRSRRRNNGTSGSLRFPCASWKPKFSGKEGSFFSRRRRYGRPARPAEVQPGRPTDLQTPTTRATSRRPAGAPTTPTPTDGKAKREPLPLTFLRCCWWWWWSVACIAPRPPRPQRCSAAREATRICPAAPPHARPSPPPRRKSARERQRASEIEGRDRSPPPLPSRIEPRPQPERSPRSVARASLATEQLAARVEGGRETEL